MGGEAWGGTTVPTQTAAVYQAISGLKDATTWGDPSSYAIYNFRAALEAAWDLTGSTSPYALAVLHDPNPELDDALSRLEDADVLVQMFDPETDWEDLLAKVKARIDADLTWEGDIVAVVDAFDTANIPALQRSKARQQAQLGEMGAAYGTAFFLAGATLEKAHNDKVAEYRAQMLLEAKKLRASIVLQAISQLFDALRYRIESNRIMAQMRLDFAKANILANSDLVANQIKVDVEAERWNLNLLSEVRAHNIMSGAPTLQRGLEPWQAGLSLILNTAGSAMNVLPGLFGK